MIVLLDNYDSFVHNLDRYLRRLGQQTLVVRSDSVSVSWLCRLPLSALLISPGPKAPPQAGCSLEAIRRLAGKVPILGVCLGHQAIGQAFGGEVVQSDYPMHGQSSRVHHVGGRLWQGLPNPLVAGRYHSLCLRRESLPTDQLRVTAWTDDGTVMAIEHCHWPIFGVQFHPESILTEGGYQLLDNFLAIAGLSSAQPLPASDLVPSPTGDAIELVVSGGRPAAVASAIAGESVAPLDREAEG
jgi:anthranilate synthase/aminodeoxychorismate synthase-like glutamine amidotransferase